MSWWQHVLTIWLLLNMAFAAFAEPAKDRKDFLIEAYTSQRAVAQSDAAACYADASIMIAKLQAEIAELKAKLEPKKED